MPELPEVETVRRGLTRLVVGRKVLGTEVRWEKTISGMAPEEFDAELVGRTIEKVDRRGKYLLFRFSGGLTMVSHLRMEGAYYTVPAGTEPGSMTWSHSISMRALICFTVIHANSAA